MTTPQTPAPNDERAKHVERLRDMRAFSANDFQKPALDYAIAELTASAVERDEAISLLRRVFHDLIAGSQVEVETCSAIASFLDPKTFGESPALGPAPNDALRARLEQLRGRIRRASVMACGGIPNQEAAGWADELTEAIAALAPAAESACECDPAQGYVCGDCEGIDNALATPAAGRAPSYDALLIIVQSVCGALERAGITDCDDPGEAIDVLREGYEAKLQAALGTAANADFVLVPREPTEAMRHAYTHWNRRNTGPVRDFSFGAYEAMLAAAHATPAAHPDALADGTRSKSTLKRHAALGYTATPAGEVDSAMIERAIEAYHSAGLDNCETMEAARYKAMYVALTAALHPEPVQGENDHG